MICLLRKTFFVENRVDLRGNLLHRLIANVLVCQFASVPMISAQ